MGLRFNALLDFVRQSRDGLRGIEKEAATRVVKGLAGEGMSAHDLLGRIIRSEYVEALFLVLYDEIGQDADKRIALLDAMLALPESVWGDGALNAGSVATKFARAEDFNHLLKHHKDAILYKREASYLLGHFSPDEYWLKRVRWYIVKRDYRRTWDELRRAERGYFIGSKEETPRFGKWDPMWYSYEASQESVATLARELCDAMIGPGLISSETSLADYFRQQRNAKRRVRIEQEVARMSACKQ